MIDYTRSVSSAYTKIECKFSTMEATVSCPERLGGCMDSVLGTLIPKPVHPGPISLKEPKFRKKGHRKI